MKSLLPKWHLAEIGISLLGVIVMVALLHNQLTSTPVQSDFSTLWAGASFHGTIQMYDPQAIAAVIPGTVIDGRHDYPRWPYYSFLTFPISRFSYPTAYIVMRLLSIVAIVFACLFWPKDRGQFTVAVCWSLPVFITIAAGQDDLWLLLFVAFIARLMYQHHWFAAGLVFALPLSIKPHLFLLVLLVVLVKRLWMVVAGTVAGGLVLYLFSACLAGFLWPIHYLKTATDPRCSPQTEFMVGTRALWQSHPAVAIICGLVLVALLLIASRQSPVTDGIALALCCGLLMSPHSYVVDCVLLLPLVSVAAHSLARLAIAFVLSPIPIFLLASGFAFPLQLGMALVLFAIAIHTFLPPRKSTPAATAAEVAAAPV